MADFLEQALSNEPQVEEPVVETPEPEAAPAEPTPEMEAPVEAKPEAEPEQRGNGYVPIDAMLTEREKRQAAERRLAEIEAQRQPASIPDSFDDPAGYNAYVQQQIATAVQQNRVDMSWNLAVRDHGKDKVEEAKVWALEKAEKDPVFRNQVDAAFATEALPIDWVVQQHKRDALLSDIGENVDDWFTREAAKRGYVAQSAAPAAPVQAVAAIPASKPAMPPRSIAGDATAPAPASSDNPMAGMDAIFNRR